jgi:hypothetical protein
MHELRASLFQIIHACWAGLFYSDSFEKGFLEGGFKKGEGLFIYSSTKQCFGPLYFSFWAHQEMKNVIFTRPK